jgi:hypothetical protein
MAFAPEKGDAISEMGQTQKSGHANGKSALPSRPDMVTRPVRSESANTGSAQVYSITSSARAYTGKLLASSMLI